MGAKSFFWAFKQAAKNWNRDKAPRLSAAIAFYAMLSLAPLLLIAISIAGLVYGEAAARDEIVTRLAEPLGPAPAQILQQAIASTANVGQSALAIAVGVFILVLTATRLFAELQDDLNTIWQVKTSRSSVLATIRTRLLAFVMIIIIGVLLIMMLFLSTLLSALHSRAGDMLGGSSYMWRIMEMGVTLAAVTLMFAIIFKYLPDVSICWHDLWVGSAFTAVLFTVGTFLIGMYLGRSTVGSAYGAAGSLVVLLLWIYYSAMIFLYGAHFTRAYAKARGADIRPGRNARWAHPRHE